MLIELTVRNLAIFEDVRVPFSAGLNVVTGETGAGKSLLVEAIRLALGEKADPVAVRTGEPEAEVTALFDLSRRDDLRDAWEEAGLPWEEEVVLRRVLPGRRAEPRLPERAARGPARAGGALPASPHDGRAAQRPGASLPRRGAVGRRRLRRRGGALLGDAETVSPRGGAAPAGRGGGGPRGRRPEPDGDPRLRDRGAVEGGAHPRRGGGARRGSFAAAQRGEGARGAPGGGRRDRVVGERRARLDGVRPRAPAGGGRGRPADRGNAPSGSAPPARRCRISPGSSDPSRPG